MTHFSYILLNDMETSISKHMVLFPALQPN